MIKYYLLIFSTTLVNYLSQLHMWPEEVTKEEFYHTLQDTLEIISSHYITVVLINANTMLGPEARIPHIRPHICTIITETTNNDNGG